MQLPGYLAGTCSTVGVDQLQVPLAQGSVHPAALRSATMAATLHTQPSFRGRWAHQEKKARRFCFQAETKPIMCDEESPCTYLFIVWNISVNNFASRRDINTCSYYA